MKEKILISKINKNKKNKIKIIILSEASKLTYGRGGQLFEAVCKSGIEVIKNV